MNMNLYPIISVVLPSHNEASSLPIVIKSVLDVLRDQNTTPEIIVVDDGSTDGTREVVQALSARHGHIRYLRLARNFGKEAALSAGLKYASGAAVILMDADGQHPTALLPRFIEQWRKGYQLVYGVQAKRREPALIRFLKRRYYSLIQIGASVVIPPDAGDFRLLDRKVVDALNSLPERNRFMKGLYAWVGFKTDRIPYDAAPRLAGQSRFGLLRLFALGITGLTSFSMAPLRLVSAAGVIVSIASILYGIYLLFEHYVQGDQLPGWATLAVGMMFLSGIQLLSLGIIAEYLGRVFEEVKQRPLYIIAEDSFRPHPAQLPIHLSKEEKQIPNEEKQINMAET